MQSTRIFNIQLSFFGDFNNLVTADKNLTDSITDFLKGDDFISSAFGEVSMNPEKAEIVSRPAFFNGKKFTINLGSQRIDLSQTFDLESNQDNAIFDNFKMQSIKYATKISEVFDSSINRMALNLLEIFSEEDGNKISEKFGNQQVATYYTHNSPIEWEEKVISRKKVNGSEGMIINVGLTLRKGEAVLAYRNESHQFDGVAAIFDINTVPSQTKSYARIDLGPFVDLALEEFHMVNNTLRSK